MRHPLWDYAQQRDLELSIQRITCTFRVAAHVLTVWSPSRPFHFTRTGRSEPILGAPALLTRRAVTHSWKHIPDLPAWQCAACVAVTKRGPALKPRWHSLRDGSNSASRVMLT